MNLIILAAPRCTTNSGGARSSRPSKRVAGGGYQGLARVEKRIRFPNDQNPVTSRSQVRDPRGGEAAVVLLGGHPLGLLQHLLRCSRALRPAGLALRVPGNCRVRVVVYK